MLKTNTSKMCRLAGGDGLLKSIYELQHNSFLIFSRNV